MKKLSFFLQYCFVAFINRSCANFGNDTINAVKTIGADESNLVLPQGFNAVALPKA